MNYLLVILGIFLLIAGIVQSYGKRWRGRLNSYPTFSSDSEPAAPVKFEYITDDPKLAELREKYALDEVAGDGPQVQQIINLMKWVHRQSKHARDPEYPDELHAYNLLELCQNEGLKLNCYMYALILNEVYLSMGFSSRLVHLIPQFNENKESHWVTTVYADELERWIMMDPDMGGYAGNEKGELLGLTEIRQRLISGQPLAVNRDIGGFVKILGKWSYPWYLSKNLFRFNCNMVSKFHQETGGSGRTFVELLPEGFQEENLMEPETTARGNTIIYTCNEEIFWQAP